MSQSHNLPDSPLFFVMNSGSGRNDTSSTQQTIETLVKEAGRTCHMCVAHEGSQIPKLAQQAVEQAKACGGTVVAVGGDGTINAVASAVLGSGCPLGVLPQGTFNYFGRTHGISQDLATALQALLKAKPQAVQVGLLNDRLFLVNASMGLYPQLLEDREVYKQEYGRSRLVALWSALVSLCKQYHQLRITIERQDTSTELRTPTLFIGNNQLQLEQIGIPKAEVLQQGQLMAIAVRPVNNLALFWLMVRGAFSTLGNAENVTHFNFRRLVVKPTSTHRHTRFKVAMDGEIIWLAAPLEFRVSPEPLMLLKDGV